MRRQWVYRHHDGPYNGEPTRWTLLGGQFAPPDDVETVYPYTENTSTEFNLRSSVQFWVHWPELNYGVILRSAATQGRAVVCGLHDATCDAAQLRPILQVTYAPGDIYHAQQWTGDPADEDSRMLAEEWARIGTTTARREIADLVTTRSTVACDDEPQEQCDEVRYRTLDSQIDGAPPGAVDAFARYQAAVGDDDVLEPSGSTPTPTRPSTPSHMTTSTPSTRS